MAKYAATTTVSTEKTLTEIKNSLKRYGADGFASGDDSIARAAWVMFRVKGIMYRLDVKLPDPKRFQSRTAAAHRAKLEQEERRLWRVMLLRVKVRLEEVAEDVPFEEAFMPFVMLPNGSTFKDFALPELKRVYETASAPQMLPWSKADD